MTGEPAPDLPAAIAVRGVYKSFGTRRVLLGVDLDVGAAENVVVLGRSGSGKSVLIKLIVGLLQPDEGEIRVLGESVRKLSRRALDALRVRIGFSFQHSALYDSMSVAENLAFPMVMNRAGVTRAEIADRVDQALSDVGLLESRSQMPAELSGGQRKRIGIARALILNPEIMLYDEPTAGLDPTTCGEINDLIVQVQETYRTSAIIITHDLTCAKDTGDRVAMLLDGQMTPATTFERLFDTDDARIRAFYDYNFTQSSAT